MHRAKLAFGAAIHGGNDLRRPRALPISRRSAPGHVPHRAGRIQLFWVIGLIGILLIGGWWRVRNHRHVFLDDGKVFFGGDSDPYAHLRLALYTYANWPDALAHDRMSGGAAGWRVGWPPGLHLLIATLSLAADVAAPGGFHLERIAAVLPPAIGLFNLILLAALVVRVGLGWKASLWATFIYAASPYTIYASLLGCLDHHPLEPTWLLLPLWVLWRQSEGEKTPPRAPATAEAAFDPRRSGSGTTAWRGLAGGLLAMAGFWCWHGQYLQIALIALVVAIDAVTHDAPTATRNRQLAGWFAIGLWLGSHLLPPTVRVLDLGPGADDLRLLLDLRRLWLIPLAFVGLWSFTTWAWGATTAGRRILILTASGAGAVLLGIAGGWFGDLGPFVATVLGKRSSLLLHVGEYLPLTAVAPRPDEAIAIIFGRATAVIGGLGLVCGRRRLPASIVGLGVATLALACWQVRLAYYAAPWLALTAGWAIDRALTAIGAGRPWLTILLAGGVGIAVVADVPTITGSSPTTLGIYQAGLWLRAETPPTGSLLEPAPRVDWTVMTPPDAGNIVVYVGQRPVTANAHNAGIRAFADYYLAPDEATAMAALINASSSYVLDLPGARFQEALIAGISGRPVPVGGSFARRLREGYPGLSPHLRPVFVSRWPAPPSSSASPTLPVPGVILYQRVTGAVVHIPWPPPATATTTAPDAEAPAPRVATGTAADPGSNTVILTWPLALPLGITPVSCRLQVVDGQAEGRIPAPIDPRYGPARLAGRPVRLQVATEEVLGGAAVSGAWPADAGELR